MSFDAADADYKLNIIKELPDSQDRGSEWGVGNLARAQINLTPSNILTTSLLLNTYRSSHLGLSILSPLETTRNLHQLSYLFAVKDQSYMDNGILLEFGMGLNRYNSKELPLGTVPYSITPEGTSGNYFRTSDGNSQRLQFLGSAIFPTVTRYGRHEMQVGADIDFINFDQSYNRRPISIFREDGSISREIKFSGGTPYGRQNFELGLYGQDRWIITNRFLIETGVRMDWDQITRDILLSPRLASSCIVTKNGNTKIVSGVGIYYDASNLDLITRPQAGMRLDIFRNPVSLTKVTAREETAFQVNDPSLRTPKFLNWSIGLEQMLPKKFYLQAEVIRKSGNHGYAFVNQNPTADPGLFTLRNNRQDRYYSFHFTLRKSFKDKYMMLASYARSKSWSNAILDFNIDNPIFGQQAPGPYDWDAPNRILSWGWLPLKKGIDLAYSLEWRTGYPFSVVNQDQQLVGSPNSHRYPMYFSLNIHAEKKFHLFNSQWALRAGLNNITNRHNPAAVNNNIDSEQFGTFGATQHRVFTARIRLIGKK